MLKKVIKYTDYNGTVRQEPFYFNLSKIELAEMYTSASGGLDEYIKRISVEQDQAKLLEMFQTIIKKAYGKKSDDGRRFIKSPEILEEFLQSEAYPALFTEMLEDSKAASDFFEGIIPELTPEQKKEVEQAKEALIADITVTE